MRFGHLLCSGRAREELLLQILEAQKRYARALEAEAALSDHPSDLNELRAATAYRDAAFEHYRRSLRQFSDFTLRVESPPETSPTHGL